MRCREIRLSRSVRRCEASRRANCAAGAAVDDEAARAAASESVIVALTENLRDAQAQWNAERDSLECSLAFVRGTAGLWIEQNAHAV